MDEELTIEGKKPNERSGLFCAEQVEHIYNKQYPDDDRVTNCNKATRAVLEHDTAKNREAARLACSAADSAYLAADSVAATAYAVADSVAYSAGSANAKLQKKICLYGLGLLGGAV